MTTQLFLSYAREDVEIARELRNFTAQFLDGISWWDDSQIDPGDAWDNEIEIGLNLSQGAVLLVSHHSLASTYIWSREVAHFRQQNKPITWLIVRACPWDRSGHYDVLSSLQALLNPAKDPIGSLASGQREALLTDVTRKLEKWTAGFSTSSSIKTLKQTAHDETVVDSTEVQARSNSANKFAFRPLFGREEEEHQICTILDRAIDTNSGGGIVLSGEAGLGKTALVEFAMHQAVSRSFEVVSTACESFHEGISFFCIKELMRQIAGAAGLVATVRKSFGHNSSETSLAEIAQDPSSESPNKKEAMIATFSNLIFSTTVSSAKPLLIVVDDLEKIDVGSVDALICLVARFREGPVIFLGALRSDLTYQPSAGSNPLRSLVSQARRKEKGLNLIELSQISEAKLPDMVAFFLNGETRLPVAFFRRLFIETDGNPLYVKEVLSSLSSKKIYGDSTPLRRDGQYWVFMRTGKEWEIPNSIEDAVALTLQELTDEQRAVLDVAAVVGKRWSLVLIYTLLQKSEDDTVDIVEQLLNNNMVKDAGRSGEDFEFKHSKIRDVVYAQLSSIKKRRTHVKIAEFLSKTGKSESYRDHNVLVARHYFLGGKYQEALPRLLESGTFALQNSAGSEASSLFTLAKEAAEQIEESTDVLREIDLQLGIALKATAEYEAAETALHRVIESSQVTSAIFGIAKCHLADIHVVRGRIAAAESCYREAETIALATDQFDLAAEAAAGLCELHMRQYEKLAGGQRTLAEEHLQKYLQYLEVAREHTAKTDKNELIARSLRNRAKRERTLGNIPSAISLYKQSVDLQDKGVFNHRFYIPYAKCLRFEGRLEDARRIVEQVLEWGRQIGSIRSEAIARQYLGLIMFEMAIKIPRSFEDSQQQLSMALIMHEQIGYAQGMQETNVMLAEVSLAKNDMNSVLDHLSKAFSEHSSRLTELIVAATDQLTANGELDRAKRMKLQFDSQCKSNTL